MHYPFAIPPFIDDYFYFFEIPVTHPKSLHSHLHNMLFIDLDILSPKNKGSHFYSD
jgi:hypothetical protein